MTEWLNWLNWRSLESTLSQILLREPASVLGTSSSVTVISPVRLWTRALLSLPKLWALIPEALSFLMSTVTTRPSRINTKKRGPFHYWGLEYKSRKSRNTCNKGKFCLGVQNEAGQRFIEFCQENALVIAHNLSQQHKRRLYTCTSPDGQRWKQIDYILCSQRWRRSIQSAKTRPGAHCGIDNEHLIAKFRLKLKKVGKTTRPFRCDLNHIPLDRGSDK